MPLTANDQKMSEEQYPGRKTDQKEGMQGHREAKYTEGQIVGYRWYDRHKGAPPPRRPRPLPLRGHAQRPHARPRPSSHSLWLYLVRVQCCPPFRLASG